jgi:hypothetical protein
MAVAGVLTLGACIQGPWDYYPDNPPPFRGVFATGYVLADRPIEQMCFERVLDIAEEHTQAYAFYDSAEVAVTGRFSGAVQTVHLTLSDSTPNCFVGDTALKAERGNDYTLDARLKWDSAGHEVLSRVTGTAHVPTGFSIRRTAAAPRFAKIGGIPSNIFSPEFALKLPKPVQDSLRKVFGDTLIQFQLNGDTANARKFILRRGKEISTLLLDLLSSDYYEYKEGDTLYYLNGALNTLSHYFTSDRSADVQCVLVTQRFERNSSRPETRFDSPLGFKPDSGEYYFPGEVRRLLLYPEAKSSKGGWSLLDSIGVVNTWFHTGRNRLYFYGFEQAYYQYHSTATQTQGGGGPEDGDPRVKVKNNVLGGQGFFVGGAVDSFDVRIRIDSLTKAYQLPAARAAGCRKDGWFDNKDCREYYPEYCRENNWARADCRFQAWQTCVAPDSADSAAQAMCDTLKAAAGKDTLSGRSAVQQYCVENGFPGIPECAGAQAACLETKGRNPCKSALWDYCLDHQWKPAQCGAGLASYCRDKPRLSETLCRHADAWCAAHADSPLCK